MEKRKKFQLLFDKDNLHEQMFSALCADDIGDKWGTL